LEAEAVDEIAASTSLILTISMKFEQIGTTSFKLGEVRNVSINWKNLGKFQQIKSSLAKLQ